MTDGVGGTDKESEGSYGSPVGGYEEGTEIIDSTEEGNGGGEYAGTLAAVSDGAH